LLLSAHDFGGTTPRAAQRRINIPTLQSYRLWSLLSTRQPPPWKCSRPGWMELCATWSSGRCPCP